jgi:hypothetical protein
MNIYRTTPVVRACAREGSTKGGFRSVAAFDDRDLVVQLLEAQVADATPAVQTAPRSLISDDEVATPSAGPQARVRALSIG